MHPDDLKAIWIVMDVISNPITDLSYVLQNCATIGKLYVQCL